MLFWDLFRDFDLTADLIKRLELLCYHIVVTFRKKLIYVATRWLLVLDVSIDFLELDQEERGVNFREVYFIKGFSRINERDGESTY